MREGGELRLGPLNECLESWLGPRFRHFLLYEGGKFQALISAENVSADEMALHIRAAPGANPRVTRDAVCSLGIAYFEAGGRTIVTQTRYGNRPAFRFAKACGMRRPFLGKDGYWHFSLHGWEYLSGEWQPPHLVQAYGQ